MLFAGMGQEKRGTAPFADGHGGGGGDIILKKKALGKKNGKRMVCPSGDGKLYAQSPKGGGQVFLQGKT